MNEEDLEINQKKLIDENLNEFAEKCAKIIHKLYLMCYSIHTLENYSIDEALNILNESNNSNFKPRSLSDVFYFYIQPYFEMLKNMFINDSNSQYSSKEVFSIIQYSLSIIMKNIIIFKNNIEESIEHNRNLIELIYEEFNFNTINKAITLIHKDTRLNMTIKLNEDSGSLPLDLMPFYTQSLKNKLANSNIKKSTDFINDISQSLIQMQNINFKTEFSEIKNLSIPDEILINIPSYEAETDVLKKFYSEIQTGSKSNISFSQLSFDCNKNLSNVLKKFSDELSSLSYTYNTSFLDKSNKTKLLIDLEKNMRHLLNKLEEIYTESQIFIKDQELENQSILLETAEDETIEQINNFQIIGKIFYDLKKLFKEVEDKITHHNSLQYYLFNLQNIDRSIIKYMAESILKNEIFILNFVKYSWIPLFWKLLKPQPFSQILLNLDNNINKNYMIVLGSINTRSTTQFMYENNFNFFNNNQLLKKIKNNYYDGLENGLGNLVKKILFQILTSRNSINSVNQELNSIQFKNDTKTNSLKLYVERKSIANSPDYELCYCTVLNSNKPINLIQHTADFYIIIACIKYLINNNKENIDIILEFLEKESFCNLTEIVYTRWLLWISFFTGVILNNEFDPVINIELDENKFPLLKHCIQKHVRNLNYLNTIGTTDNSSIKNVIDNEFSIQLIKPKSFKKVILSNDELAKYVNQFPSKNEVMQTINSDNDLYEAKFDMSDNYKKLETLLILMNHLSYLGCSTIYYFKNNTFNLIKIKTNTIRFKFIN